MHFTIAFLFVVEIHEKGNQRAILRQFFLKCRKIDNFQDRHNDITKSIEIYLQNGSFYVMNVIGSEEPINSW